MLKLHKNGIVMQTREKNCNNDYPLFQGNGNYYGIDGLIRDNWYLSYEKDIDKEIKEYSFDYIEHVYFLNNSYIGCCDNLDYIEAYIKESKKRNIKYRVLFCETTQKRPFFKEHKNLHLKFLGYDYAYPDGDYYSCLFHEINNKYIPEFCNIKLNKYGLFETEKEILSFINLRNNLKDKSRLELGDFFIYKLSEVLNIENLFLK